MSFAYFVLLVAIIVAPIFEFANARFGAEFAMAAAAASLLVVATRAKSADKDHFLRASKGVRWVLIGILLCIAAQLIPVFHSVAHPIWSASYDALPGVAIGFITADLGLTIRVFFLALALIALACVMIIVARDRRRAELLLVVLAAVTTAVTFIELVGKVMPALKFAPSVSDLASPFAGFGLLLNFAVIQLAAERAETHHSLFRSLLLGGCGLTGALIDASFLFAFSSANLAIPAGCGVVAFLLVLIMRRLDLSNLAASALAAATLAGTGIILAWLFERASGPLLLRLVPALPEETRAALERLLTDTRWFGAGAGAFQAVARIYQSSEEVALHAPSGAAALFVDAGWIGASMAIAAGVAVLLRLFAGALRRGRDSFFPASAAACLCFAILESFTGPGLLRVGGAMALSLILGVGFSQTVSQSSR